MFEGGVVNAASFLRSSVPGGAIAQGSIFSIFGRSLGPRGLEAQEFPLPAELGGVTVEIVTNDGELFVPPLLYVGEGQVNAVAPSTLPVGEHGLRVLRGGEPSNSVRFKVVRASVGLFSYEHFGYPAIVGTNLFEPLRPGATAALWATGLGPITAGDGLPAQVELPTNIRVKIGHLDAQILYQGRASCCAGLDQINVVIPDGAPLGCFVPVWVEVGGDLYSNVAVVAIAEPGRECWEAPGTFAKPFVEAPIGRFEVSRAPSSIRPDEPLLDRATAGFKAPRDEQPTDLPADDVGLLPAFGTCAPRQTTAQSSVQFTDIFAVYNFEGPAGLSTLTTNTDRLMLRPFNDDLIADPPLDILPGPYRVTKSGGGRSPNFTAEMELPPAPIWSDKEEWRTSSTERKNSVAWTGGDPSISMVIGALFDCRTDGSNACIIGGAIAAEPSFRRAGYFQCRVSVSAGRFEIPRAFLDNIPDPTILLQLTNLPDPAPMQFDTDGPEAGLMVMQQAELVPVLTGPVHLASTPVILPDGSEIQAEVAANFGERQRGLMSREFMPADQGMLFLFPSSGNWRFWMLNTLIPLDILWMNDDREIFFISADTPPCPAANSCPTYGPNEASRYVLELNAGEAARRGLAVGDRLDW